MKLNEWAIHRLKLRKRILINVPLHDIRLTALVLHSTELYLHPSFLRIIFLLPRHAHIFLLLLLFFASDQLWEGRVNFQMNKKVEQNQRDTKKCTGEANDLFRTESPEVNCKAKYLVYGTVDLRTCKTEVTYMIHATGYWYCGCYISCYAVFTYPWQFATEYGAHFLFHTRELVQCWRSVFHFRIIC